MWELASLLLTVTCGFAIGQELTIECPFPEGQSVSSEFECGKYTACTWIAGTCVMGSNSDVGYTVASPVDDTGVGFRVTLAKINPSLTMFDADITELVFEAVYHDDYHLQVKISDPASARYEVPVPVTLPSSGAPAPLYTVAVPQAGEPFTLQVMRAATGATLFQSEGPLTYEDQFLQVTTRLASSFLYGFGENSHTNWRHQFDPRVTFPIFARDQPVAPAVLNQYGALPYYQLIEDDEGNTHSVLFMNSNAMEYSTFLTSDGSPALTLRTIGGIVDLHFFLGPHPEDVNVQYTKVVGHAAFPPYWSLGFHLSRYGYTSVDHVRAVRQAMKDYGIPQDVQTFDIDYMERYRDFTYDPVNWSELPQLIDEIHNDNAKVTLILDPALVIDWDNYPPAARGRDADVFVKWMSPDLVPADQPTGAMDYMVGYVWPDTKTVFPDFLKHETQTWWGNELSLLRQILEFDAIWIDMNEPANFGTNLDKPFNYPDELEPWSLKCPFTRWDSPPYPTLTANLDNNESKRISDKTICMSAHQSDNSTTFLHYDVHSLYGWAETVATYRGLENLFPGKRPVVLSRSTFPGSGKYAVHWLGDNNADWTQMAMSIVGMLEFNLFGLPMVGADICGFFNEPSEELCIRWMQLGAFYPFSRNHNTIGTADQDPASSPALAAASRDVLLLRYRYLPHLYTLFHEAHMNGGSVVRSLYNLSPKDQTARGTQDQFTWGSEVMVAPVLTEGATERLVHFTEGLWYDLVTGVLESSSAGTRTVDAPMEKIPVFVLGGAILPSQEPATTTVESRLNPMGLTIALNETAGASGRLYWDDGDAEHVAMEDTYMTFFNYADGTLSQSIAHGQTVVAGLSIQSVHIYGFSTNLTSIVVNGVALDVTAWMLDDVNGVLKITMLTLLSEEMTMIII